MVRMVMGGSKALGMCVKRHRGHRSQQLLADMTSRSLRWLSYVEAGTADVAWGDLAAIASALGGDEGRAFLEDTSALLYEEAEVEGTRKDALAPMQGLALADVMGTVGGPGWGAAHGWQEIGLDAGLIDDMGTVTRTYASQSRTLGPELLLPMLQTHLRSYLDLTTIAPFSMDRSLKAGAAEVALLCGVLCYRLGEEPDALHYWLLASGMAAESGHDAIGAFALGVRASLLHAPPTRGGRGQGDPRQASSLLDQALALGGSSLGGVVGAALYSWRSHELASLDDAPGAARDLEKAQAAWAQHASVDDLTGLGPRSDLELLAEQVVAAIHLGWPDQSVAMLEKEVVASHPSSSWRSGRMADLAAAYALRGDYDQAADALWQAAQTAISARDIWRVRRVQGVRARWLPLGYRSEVLEETDRRLALVAARPSRA